MEPTRDNERWLHDDLDALEASCWAELTRAALVPHEPLRLPTLSTQDPDLGPTSRTVVLRRCNDRARRLELHTDLRADKVAHLRADPRHAWHFYDDGQQLQLRALAVASLHHDDHVADAAWSRLSPGSQRSYCASDPGARRDAHDSGLPTGWWSRRLDPEEVAHGRANFCAVRAQVTRLEVLHLSTDGHRRARFTYDGHLRVDATWLIP